MLSHEHCEVRLNAAAHASALGNSTSSSTVHKHEIAPVEKEMESLERDYRLQQDRFGERLRP